MTSPASIQHDVRRGPSYNPRRPRTRQAEESLQTLNPRIDSREAMIPQKFIVAAAISLTVFASSVNNAKNVRAQLDYIRGEGAVADAPEPARNAHVASRGARLLGRNNTATPDCLRARNDSVPAHLFGNLPKPYINLGFPKMGTSTLHAYFECGGLISTHFKCRRSATCASCIRESVEAGLPPLSKCRKKKDVVYAQIDDGYYFPQIELLDEIVIGQPDATFFLTFRDMPKWYHSITHWPPRKRGPHMDERFKKFNITGSPPSEGESNPEEFNDWYCKHVERVRELVARNPSHTLVEVNIEDPLTGQRMEDIFDIDKACWRHINVNPNIHSGVDESEFVFSKGFGRIKHGFKKDETDDSNVNNGDDMKSGIAENIETENSAGSHDDQNDEMDDSYANDGDGGLSGSAEDVESDDSVGSYDEPDEDYSKEDNNESHYFQEKKPQSSVLTNIDNPTCLKARHDTVPSSLLHKLPKPYVNLGFPKMGTTTLYSFFKCGGLISTHYRCGKDSKKCGVCTKESVKVGLPPLSQCGKADVYTQIDDGTYFPQIELLEEFIHGHPDATFFLTFRNMSKWYHSITHWPPRKRGPHMDERFKKFNITGSPPREGKSNPEEFSDWYCKHVERVRELVAKNPSHTLVEVDIEDPGVGQRMEGIFGIDKACWGHTNANANIHSDLNQSDVVLSRAFTRLKKEEIKKKDKRKRHLPK